MVAWHLQCVLTDMIRVFTDIKKIGKACFDFKILVALKWDSERHCFVLNPLSLLVIIKLFATGPNGLNNNDETDQLIYFNSQ